MELTELRVVPPKIRSAPVEIGITTRSSGSEVELDDEDDPVEVRTPTTVSGTPLSPTSIVWPTGSTPLKSSDAVVAPNTATAVWSLTSWSSMKRPWARARPRTVSQVEVDPCTVVVHVLDPATSSSEDEV